MRFANMQADKGDYANNPAGCASMPKQRASPCLGAIKGLLELLGVELDHLPHGFVHGLLLFLVLAGLSLHDLHGKNLPTHTKLVDQPTALHRLTGPAYELLPVGIDLALGFAWHA